MLKITGIQKREIEAYIRKRVKQIKQE